MDDAIESVVRDLLTGLTEGLQSYSGPIRAAVMIAQNANDAPLVFDPQGLLAERRSELAQRINSDMPWRETAARVATLEPNMATIRVNQRDLGKGLIASDAYSPCISFQLWVVEDNKRIGNRAVVQSWIRQSAESLVNAALSTSSALYAATSLEKYISDFANGAIRAYLRPFIETYQVTDPVTLFLRLSTTNEEQKGSSGQIIFLRADMPIELEYLVRFDESTRLPIRDVKQVRKLLGAVGEGLSLVCDEAHVVGIARHASPHNTLWAKYKKGRGQLFVGGEFVCSVINGQLKSFPLPPTFVFPDAELSIELAGRLNRGKAEKTIREIIQRVYDVGAGCTLVIDLSEHGLPVSGIALERPLELDTPEATQTAGLMASVDGALLIDRVGSVRRFACLLDGLSVSSEDLARGARYNSALRFSVKYPKDALILVVSSDGSVSHFYDGVDLTKHRRQLAAKLGPVSYDELQAASAIECGHLDRGGLDFH